MNDSATRKEMDEMQKKFTSMAVKFAKDDGFNLDFSHESIKDVETILSRAHKEYKKSKTDEGKIGNALGYAAYIITTIEKNTEKGRWDKDHPHFGEDTFPFYWRNQTMFIFHWCLKRINEGEEDDVWFKYQGAVLNKLKGSN